jgi:hypothetical protein
MFLHHFRFLLWDQSTPVSIFVNKIRLALAFFRSLLPVDHGIPRAEDWALIDGGLIAVLGDFTIEVSGDSTNDALSSFRRPSFVLVDTARRTYFLHLANFEFCGSN